MSSLKDLLSKHQEPLSQTFQEKAESIEKAYAVRTKVHGLTLPGKTEHEILRGIARFDYCGSARERLVAAAIRSRIDSESLSSD